MPVKRKSLDELVAEAEEGKSGSTLAEAKMKEFKSSSILRALRDLLKGGKKKKGDDDE